MTFRNKRPDPVRQHGIGARSGNQMNLSSASLLYSSHADLQSRHLMRRCGVGRRQASLIATLLFGEDGK